MILTGPYGNMGNVHNTNPCCSSTTVPDTASSNMDSNVTMGWGDSPGFSEPLGPSNSVVPRLHMAQVMDQAPDSLHGLQW